MSGFLKEVDKYLSESVKELGKKFTLKTSIYQEYPRKFSINRKRFLRREEVFLYIDISNYKEPKDIWLDTRIENLERVKKYSGSEYVMCMITSGWIFYKGPDKLPPKTLEDPKLKKKLKEIEEHVENLSQEHKVVPRKEYTSMKQDIDREINKIAIEKLTEKNPSTNSIDWEKMSSSSLGVLSEIKQLEREGKDYRVEYKEPTTEEVWESGEDEVVFHTNRLVTYPGGGWKEVLTKGKLIIKPISPLRS